MVVIRTCERFERQLPNAPGAAEFVAIYEIEADDPDALLTSLFDAASTMQMTDALDPTSPRFEILRPIDTKRSASPTKGTASQARTGEHEPDQYLPPSGSPIEVYF